MKALLVGSSPHSLDAEALALLASGCSLAIGVDGGTDALISAGVAVDLVVGDMDSLSERAKELVDSGRVKSVRHPRDKDESDLELALNWCREHSVYEIACAGVTGGRLDHTLAAVGSLARNRSLRPVIHDPSSTTWLLSDAGRSSVELSSPGTTVSVIALEDGSRLQATGLKWALPARMTPLWDRGLSNVVTGANARVSITRGVALVIVNESVA